MTESGMQPYTISDAAYGAEYDPPYLSPDYVATRLRAPQKPLVRLAPTLTERTGPVFGPSTVGAHDNDLTRHHSGDPIGERIIVSGRVCDIEGRPLRGQLIEIWQANAAGRYRHEVDQHPAPLDPNFSGAGRCISDDDGSYRFLTIKPGAYPWRNHANAWRPAHIHFSLLGPATVSRLVTQMYFPDDPLFALDPIFNSAPTERARQSMVSTYDHEVTEPEWALGYRWDIVLRGPHAPTFEVVR
jgi:protocatechuate 3,4-dioxygenase, beta subunit